MAVVESGCGGGEMVARRPCTSQARTASFPFQPDLSCFSRLHTSFHGASQTVATRLL